MCQAEVGSAGGQELTIGRLVAGLDADSGDLVDSATETAGAFGFRRFSFATGLSSVSGSASPCVYPLWVSGDSTPDRVFVLVDPGERHMSAACPANKTEGALSGDPPIPHLALGLRRRESSL